VNRIGFSQRLELRQSQALVMTPQLQQAIKMLQLSNLELSAFVEAEIEQNPLLEPGEREAEEGAAPGTEPQAD
jgi:RNA polymerase sigma-54 factor